MTPVRSEVSAADAGELSRPLPCGNVVYLAVLITPGDQRLAVGGEHQEADSLVALFDNLPLLAGGHVNEPKRVIPARFLLLIAHLGHGERLAIG